MELVPGWVAPNSTAQGESDKGMHSVFDVERGY